MLPSFTSRSGRSAAPTHLFRALLLAASTVFSSGCAEEPDLVVYVAHDQIHSEPLIRRFEDETGLSVRAEFDVEANKTIGLVNRIYPAESLLDETLAYAEMLATRAPLAQRSRSDGRTMERATSSLRPSGQPGRSSSSAES